MAGFCCTEQYLQIRPYWNPGTQAKNLKFGSAAPPVSPAEFEQDLPKKIFKDNLR